MCYRRAPIYPNKSNSESPVCEPFIKLAFILFAESDGHSKKYALGDATKDICLSQGCINTANSVLKNMNPEEEPCTDFYEFACGNFLKETVIPDDKASVSSFTAISDDLEVKLRTIIETLPDNDGAKHASLVKKMYERCKDELGIENSGYTEISKIITALGEWPVVKGSNWNPTIDWHQYAAKLRELGYSTNYIIDFGIDVDWKDTSKHLIQIDQASLGIAQEFLRDGRQNSKVQAYFNYMVDVAVLFGVDRSVAISELGESLNLEIKLAEISLKREERLDYNLLYNKFSISDLQLEFPVIPSWITYIQEVLLIPDIIINDGDEVNVNVPKYFKELQTVITGVSPRVIGNYIIWRTVMDSILYLNQELRDAQLKFNSEMSGVTERQKRWKECVSITTDRLPIAVASLYVQKHFKDEARTSSETMVRDIGNEFKDILKNIEWMDEETRQKAIEKAGTMTSHIAYPDELTQDTKLAEYYSTLTFSQPNYLSTILARNVFSVTNSFKKLRQPVDKEDWTLHANAAIVNAFYNSIYNSIEFPAGILQGIFFNNDRPRYMNYGAIGFVIGHEITHGFDNQGRQFDKNGNLAEWWNGNTKDLFKQKAQCIIDQYANYKVEEIDMNLNGIVTQGENIADNGGIKEAYLAYKSMVQREGPEKRLPGLQNYTPEQMFWISAANVWCIKYTKEDLVFRVKSGVHSPGRFRVIGPMSNLEQFSKDFNCPADSKMNPKSKCSVW